MSEDTPIIPTSSPVEPAQPEAPVKRGVGRHRLTDPKTGLEYKQTQAERNADNKRHRDARAKKAETKAIIREAIAENDFTSTAVVKKERALELFDARNLAPERVEKHYELMVDAARELRLPMNDFMCVHGIRKMQESLAAGMPMLLEEIPDEEVPGMLDKRPDLYMTWDVSCSWRTDGDYPERKSFEGYLDFCLAFKDNFFVLDEILDGNFHEDIEAYQLWEDMMPHLNARLLPRNYTQTQMRTFLNLSAGGADACLQRLLSATRSARKSSYCIRKLLQWWVVLPDLRATLLSETTPLAKSFLEQLRNFFEVQEGRETRFQQLFPHYCFPKGSGAAEDLRSPMAHLNLTQGIRSSSFQSLGHAGSRNDVIVCDDALSEATVGTPDAIAKTIATYDAMRKTLEAGGNLGSIVVLTPWAPDDLGAELQKRNAQAEAEGDFNFLKYRIDPIFTVLPHAVAKAKEDLLSLDLDNDVVLNFKHLDKHHVLRELRSTRANNFYFFKSQCLCSWDELGETVLKCTFTDEMLRGATHPLLYYSEQRLQLIDTILAIDTAWSTAATACLSAFAIVKFYQKGEGMIALVEHMSMNHFRISELGIEAAQLIHTYSPTKVLLEKTGPWESVVSEIKKACILRSYVIPDHFYAKPTNVGNTPQQKLLRIKVLETMLTPEESTLFFVANPSWNDDLFHQFIKFDGIAKNRKVDGPDSISLAIDAYWPKDGKAFVKSEEMRKMEEAAQNAANVAAMHSMIYGSSSMAPRKPTELAPEPSGRGSFGIPGLRNDGPTPTGNTGGLSWGGIHRAAKH